MCLRSKRSDESFRARIIEQDFPYGVILLANMTRFYMSRFSSHIYRIVYVYKSMHNAMHPKLWVSMMLHVAHALCLMIWFGGN